MYTRKEYNEIRKSATEKVVDLNILVLCLIIKEASSLLNKLRINKLINYKGIPYGSMGTTLHNNTFA